MEFFSNSPAPAGSNTSWERPRNNDIVVIDAAFADGLLEEMAPIDELAFDGMEMATVNDDTSTAARTTHDLHSADSSDGGYICFCPHCGNTENVRELQTGHICIGCGEILVSALNSAGISFSIGDDIFFVAKCELPFAGSIIRFPDEKSAVVRYKDSSWCFSAYDETKNIDDISTALEDLLSKNQRRGRNRRVQRFADIQLVLRDGEKEPCPKCKAMVSAKTNTCYKCNYKIRTRALPCGSHLFTGQDLFFRNKLGDMTAGVLEKILDNDMVEIRYKDPHWSLSKYNEVHPLESVASTMDNLLRHVGSRKRVAPKDFVEMSIEHERTLQVARIERTRELSIIKEREAARVAEILRKEKEREEHTREKEAARAKLQLQRQKEREKAREKRHEIKLKERERLKKMDHYERNRFKRLAKAAKARKEKKNGRDLQLIGTVVIVDNILLPGGRKITRDALNEHENRTKIAKKQAAMLAEARPCTLQLCPWVTDYVCANIQSPENEHNTFCFRPRERGKTINVSVRQMSISEVLRRVRFVEACSATIHCGLSRLDRWEQRALCHYIYKNTLPHRLSKRNGGGADAVAYAAPNISSMKVHSPYNKKGASKSRIFKQLETNLKQFISSPDNSTPSKRRVTSTSSCISTPFGGRYRHHLADVDCSFLTVGLLERVLWACPTNEREFYILVQSYELLRSPLVPALIELVNDFLELKQLTPRGHFNEVVQLNKDINALKILSTNDNDMNPVDEESTKTPKYHNLPLHCALCPQLAQSEQDRLRPIYTQDEFTKLQATFPLTVSEFIFALNVAYERCGGRARLEGCTPAQYTIDGSEGGEPVHYQLN